MKYRVLKVQAIYCYACDCTIYELQKRRKFLWLFPYWDTRAMYYDKDEAYKKLNELRSKGLQK